VEKGIVMVDVVTGACAERRRTRLRATDCADFAERALDCETFVCHIVPFQKSHRAICVLLVLIVDVDVDVGVDVETGMDIGIDIGMEVELVVLDESVALYDLVLLDVEFAMAVIVVKWTFVRVLVECAEDELECLLVGNSSRGKFRKRLSQSWAWTVG
jgi:hypothetical protein